MQMAIRGGFDTISGERIWDDNDPAIQEAFWEDVRNTAPWKRYRRECIVSAPENSQLIYKVLAELQSDEAFVTTGMYADALETALNYGDSEKWGKFTRKPVEPTPVAEPIPLRNDGNQMTQSQQRWSEYRIFSESHSMKEVRERMRVDSGYASFVMKNREREFQSVGDSLVPQNPHLAPAEDISQASVKALAAKAGLLVPQLLEWAKTYNSTSANQVRSLRSAASNPIGYEQYEKSIQAAIAAGLI
jgi:hypothetical protein